MTARSSGWGSANARRFSIGVVPVPALVRRVNAEFSEKHERECHPRDRYRRSDSSSSARGAERRRRAPGTRLVRPRAVDAACVRFLPSCFAMASSVGLAVDQPLRGRCARPSVQVSDRVSPQTPRASFSRNTTTTRGSRSTALGEQASWQQQRVLVTLPGHACAEVGVVRLGGGWGRVAGMNCRRADVSSEDLANGSERLASTASFADAVNPVSLAHAVHKPNANFSSSSRIDQRPESSQSDPKRSTRSNASRPVARS